MFNNSVSLFGRITKDPELRTAGESSVVNFTLAVNRKRSKGEEHPVADFIQCSAWNRLAEVIEKYVSKGDRIGVRGELQQRKYTDKDGNQRVVYDVHVSDLELAESRSGGNTPVDENTPAVNASMPNSLDDYDDDDLPI